MLLRSQTYQRFSSFFLETSELLGSIVSRGRLRVQESSALEVSGSELPLPTNC